MTHLRLVWIKGRRHWRPFLYTKICMKQRLLEFFAVFLILVGVVGLSAALLPAPVAVAGTQDNLSGWAWSQNVGWISFNCTNTSSCATVDYGVHIDPTTGILSGFAWSENVGWISFNTSELAGCPSGTCEASMNFGTRAMSGWARAVSTNNLAWDGFIRLAGTNPNHGVTFEASGSALTGYAWGGEVIGWMDWKGATYGVVYNGPFAATKVVILDPLDSQALTPVQVTVQVQDANGVVDQSFDGTVTLRGNGSRNGTASLKIPANQFGSQTTVDIVNGEGVVQITDTDDETVTLSLQGTASTAGLDVTSTQQVVFSPAAQVNLVVTPQVIPIAGNVTATWTTNNNPGSCTASADPQANAPSWTGIRDVSNLVGEQVSITDNVRLTLTCGGQSSFKDVEINPISGFPEVTLTIVSGSEQENRNLEGALVSKSVELEWTFSNVASCVGEEGDTGWTNTQLPVGQSELHRYRTRSISQSTPYRIVCTGLDPTVKATSVVTVPFDDANFTPTATPNVIRVSFVSDKAEITTRTNIKVTNNVNISSATVSFQGPRLTGITSDVVDAGTPRNASQVRQGDNTSQVLLQSDFADGADLRLVVPSRLRGGVYNNFKVEVEAVSAGGGRIIKEVPITLLVQDFRPIPRER